MDKPLISFSLDNFVTIGLILAFWYVIIIGALALVRSRKSEG